MPAPCLFLIDTISSLSNPPPRLQSSPSRSRAAAFASPARTGISIDKTAPVVDIAQPAAGGFYLPGQPVPSDYTCADNLSGAANCAGTFNHGSPFDTSSVGGKTFAVNATDNAGNSAAVNVNYMVGYNLNLLYDPARESKSNSTIHLRLQLIDHTGANLSSADTVLHALGVSPAASGSYAPLADADFYFDPTANYYTLWARHAIIGAKAGLFAVRKGRTREHGYADFDWFRIE